MVCRRCASFCFQDASAAAEDLGFLLELLKALLVAPIHAIWGPALGWYLVVGIAHVRWKQMKEHKWAAFFAASFIF